MDRHVWFKGYKGRFALVACIGGLVGVIAPACSSSQGRQIPGLGATCSSNADCSAYRLQCSPAGKGCVECISSADCFAGEYCGDRGACTVAACTTQAQCPTGTTCDVASHRCLGEGTGTGGSGTGGIGAGGLTGTGGIIGGGGLPGTGGIVGSGGAGGSGPGPAYLVSGAWHGYVWTSTDTLGSTISPTDFSLAPQGGPYCATGTVTGDPGYNGYAMIGYNIAQDPGSGTTANAITPTAAGIAYSVTNNGGNALRLQIQGTPNDAAHRWCYNLTGSSGFVLYTDFNTACWDGTGSYYSGQPLTSVAVIVPGGLTSASFDICLNSVADSN